MDQSDRGSPVGRAGGAERSGRVAAAEHGTESGSPMSRRLALIGLAGGGLIAAGCSPARTPTAPAGTAEPGASTSPPVGGTQRPTDAGSPSDRSSPPAAEYAPTELETTGPDLVHGPTDRRAVALTFHGAGPADLTQRVLSIVA